MLSGTAVQTGDEKDSEDSSRNEVQFEWHVVFAFSLTL